MPAITATAPAKIILLGEHAVVYGRPAIAVPVSQLRARAVITPEPFRQPGEILIDAPDVSIQAYLSELDPFHPLARVIHLTEKAVGVPHLPACKIRISSDIPIASGLGSGAAVSVAIIRALSVFLGHPLPNSDISAIAFEIDKLYHGTPSGIDNTTVTFEQPVFFQRGHKIELLGILSPFMILVANTGIQSPTSEVVGEVRKAWEADPAIYETIFDSICALVLRGRSLIEAGRTVEIGSLMIANHHLLTRLGVSSPELNLLVEAALQAGAGGAKLSGGGRGGNMIALVDEESISGVSAALFQAGAVSVVTADIRPLNPDRTERG